MIGQLYGDGYLGHFLGAMSGFYTRELGNFSCMKWDASEWTNAWEIYNNAAAYPYGFRFTYPRNRGYYTVADPYDMSQRIAMALHGYRQELGFGGTLAKAKPGIISNGIELDAGASNEKLKTVKTLSCYVDSEDELKDEDGTDLKAKAKTLIDKAEAQIAQLKKIMANEENLSVSEVRAKVSVIYKAADGLYKEAETLSKKLKAAAEKAAEAKAAAAAAAVDAGNGDGNGDGDGDAGTLGTGDGTVADDGAAPVVDSADAAKIKKDGKSVTVKNKDGAKLVGDYYEYDGKIYLIKDGKAIDKTEKVDKITTT